MGSVIRDGTTGFWTLKFKANEKDKRIKIRRYRDDEPSKPIPTDVLADARELDPGFSPKECQ